VRGCRLSPVTRPPYSPPIARATPTAETGNVQAGEAGASLRELMDRMGHSTTRAALIYQHRMSLRDKMIADEISKRAEAEHSRSGAQRARDDTQSS